MSNLYINIRIMSWHLQVDFDWKITVSKNKYHSDKGYPDGYFKIYQFFN